MNKIRIYILFVVAESGINIDERINPQNINPLFVMLSAKNPNTGCNRDENICEIVKIIVAAAIVIPIFAAINGIIGFKTPV